MNCIKFEDTPIGGMCQFCGAKYNGGKVEADFGEDQYTGTLKVGGNEYQVYLGECIASPVIEGKNIRMRRKFTLIEM